MCFTLKLLQIPPRINIAGDPVPYSRLQNLFRLRLDGPRLTWSNHIEHLWTSCSKRLNVMKRLAGVSWGVCREQILHYYLATIRAKITYGSSLYGSAANTTLNKLDTIHNTALRISMGVMSSSPAVSLNAEWHPNLSHP